MENISGKLLSLFIFSMDLLKEIAEPQSCLNNYCAILTHEREVRLFKHEFLYVGCYSQLNVDIDTTHQK